MKLLPKGQGTLIKILSLTVGLAIGLVLIARVQLELNFDHNVPHKDRVYKITEHMTMQDEQANTYDQTAGGVAPLVRQQVPEVEAATRFTWAFDNEKIKLEDGKKILVQDAIFADSSFFEFFSARIVQGNAQKILATAGQCLVSTGLLKKMGPGAVGRSLTFTSAPDKPLTVAGVFESFDENTSFAGYDVLISMPSLGTYTYDGTANLIGNDRYVSFVRLRQDASVAKARRNLNAVMAKALPMDELRKAGYVDVGNGLEPIAGEHLKESTVRTTATIMMIVAIVLLFAAVMNYVLVAVSSLVGRARQIAIRRSMGASTASIYRMTLGESAFHLVSALVLVALLLWAGRDVVRDVMGVSVATLFSVQTVWVVSIVCLMVLACCGLLPGYIYSRIPLAYVYRRYTEHRRVWKLALIGFQFALCTMLLVVLATVMRQYSYMMGSDMGYEYENVVYIPSQLKPDSAFSFEREMEKLPYVASASSTTYLYCLSRSGNNVTLPGNDRQLFNYCELYFAESNIVKTMGLKLVEGKGFTPMDKTGYRLEVIVDEEFARKLKASTGWKEVVGHQIVNPEVSPYDPVTIVGVVADFVKGSLMDKDTRPAMMMNGNLLGSYILVKLNSMTPGNIAALQQMCNKMYPDQDLQVLTYASALAGNYAYTLRIRNLMTIGCVATLLITLVGLIGYLRDDMARRRKEMAIRRVLGASMVQLQRLFVRGVSVVALPAIVVGCVSGYIICRRLMQMFPDKTPFSAWTLVATVAIISLTLVTVVTLMTRQATRRNPVEGIKTE